MRVHPSPRKREISPPRRCGGRQRKLRRLPHVFGRVLELPLCSDADVHVLEDTTAFRFSAPTAGLPFPVRARAIDIHPGVTKVVIREAPPTPPSLSEHDDEEVQEEADEEEEELLVEDLEVDRWRFRLPAGTRPELATASYADGELVVVVPKGTEDDGGGLDGTGGGIGRLVIVQ